MSIRTRMLMAIAALTALALPTAPGVAAPNATPGPDLIGYLPLSDGVMLRYSVDLPDGPSGRYPVVLNYSPYEAGTTPSASTAAEVSARLVRQGYALVGVTIRGTGCSGGDISLDLGSWGRDGYEVVEWAAGQPWSNGRVAMIGTSGPAVAQIATAAQRPPHLVAITPAALTLDPYRDVIWPGGIFVPFIPAGWGAAIMNLEQLKGLVNGSASQGDPVCARHVAERAARGSGVGAFAQMLGSTESPYVGRTILGARTLAEMVSDIEVPALVLQSWHDQQLGSGATNEFGRFKPDRTWFVTSNGNHEILTLPPCVVCSNLSEAFFKRFLGGEQNGFEANTPHVQYWMEVQGGVMSSPNPIQPERRPAWTLTAPSWPLHTTPYELTLGANGVLGDSAAGALSYAYPASSSSLAWPEYVAEWQVPPAPAGSLAYTTGALVHDVVAAGPASLDVWLSSTAADTDVQATITEVRPDGKEVYVQRGWLRASERALDEQRSTATRPYHVHEAAARKELTPGRPELLRVEIMPFAHAFRAGSKIRVYVDAPSGVTGNWNFALNATPAVNSVHFDGSKRSALVMSVVPGAVAQATLPPCDSLASQPCRPDPLALHPGQGGAS